MSVAFLVDLIHTCLPREERRTTSFAMRVHAVTKMFTLQRTIYGRGLVWCDIVDRTRMLVGLSPEKMRAMVIIAAVMVRRGRSLRIGRVRVVFAPFRFVVDARAVTGLVCGISIRKSGG